MWLVVDLLSNWWMWASFIVLADSNRFPGSGLGSIAPGNACPVLNGKSIIHAWSQMTLLTSVSLLQKVVWGQKQGQASKRPRDILYTIPREGRDLERHLVYQRFLPEYMELLNLDIQVDYKYLQDILKHPLPWCHTTSETSTVNTQ